MQATVLMWRPEDNYSAPESVFTFYHVGLRVELGPSGLAASAFPHWTILLVTFVSIPILMIFSFCIFDFFCCYIQKILFRCEGDLTVTSVTSLIARVDSADLDG